ncbi:FadR/GntR family transcriptional regulator [Azospirillum sp. ST 5-10]|uniref:FadR/GntR family transcriptional regulator n=1 Tax=unclassified Azospirillum TaxID=2630922 RepID=UPI003F49F311
MVQIGSTNDDGPPDFGATKTLGKARIAYDHLHHHIAEGLWTAGARLPTERSLAQDLGLARNTVRRALDRMEAEGLIARGVGRGTFLVRGRTPGPPAEPVPFPLPAILVDASPAQVMELRILLEPSVAECAVVRATAADLAAMRRCLAESEAAVTVPEFEHWDGALHAAIIACCRNDLLDGIYALLNRVRNQAEWSRLKERSVTPERRAAYQQDHRTIVAALEGRDPAAAREAVRRHLIAVRDNLFAP